MSELWSLAWNKCDLESPPKHRQPNCRRETLQTYFTLQLIKCYVLQTAKTTINCGYNENTKKISQNGASLLSQKYKM